MTMASKITITITPDLKIIDSRFAPSAMAKTMALLATLTDAPTGKIVLTIDCTDEDVIDLKDDIHAALSGRPVGIDATTKTQTEESIERQRADRVTPMDKAWSN
jgi:hypothetical protein